MYAALWLLLVIARGMVAQTVPADAPRWQTIDIHITDVTTAQVPRAEIVMKRASDTRFPILHADEAGHFHARVVEGEYDLEVGSPAFVTYRTHLLVLGPVRVFAELRVSQCGPCVQVTAPCLVTHSCPKAVHTGYAAPVWSRREGYEIGMERVAPAGTPTRLLMNVILRNRTSDAKALTPCLRKDGPTLALASMPSDVLVSARHADDGGDWVCGVDWSVPVEAGASRSYQINLAQAYVLSSGRYVVWDIAGAEMALRGRRGTRLDVVVPDPQLEQDLGTEPYQQAARPSRLDP